MAESWGILGNLVVWYIEVIDCEWVNGPMGGKWTALDRAFERFIITCSYSRI